MADFAAVLRKTIGGLSENTPEMREKVYVKARAAIEKKLASITPKPSKTIVNRQMKALESAIEEVESDFAVAEAPLEDLDRILGEAEESEAAEAAVSEPEPVGELAQKADDGKSADVADEPEAAEPAPPASDTAAREAEAAGEPEAPTTGPEHELPEHEPEPEGPDAIFAALQQENQRNGKTGRRGRAAIIILAAIIVIVAGAWFGRNFVKQYTGVDIETLIGGGPAKAPEEAKTEVQEPKANEVAKPSNETNENKTEAPAPAEAAPPQKFTQRLNADGTEIDAGPAGGEASVGEGSSVAAASPPAAESGGQPQASGEAAKPQMVAVGQKAYLYEEGTSTDQATAEAGNVVWSVVQEKPGGDAPAEPAIHGVLDIPAKNVSLNITIRRNADQTLPASHIIEVVFETPDGFAGGGIAEMSRIAMKESEQATGSPLLGVPAKISDGFFLVALTDAKAAIETNTTLLQREEWIDIPVVYASGRRALFTMEKGVPGNRVFDEVMKAWQETGAE